MLGCKTLWIAKGEFEKNKAKSFPHLWSGKESYLSEGRFDAFIATTPEADRASASIGGGGGLLVPRFHVMCGHKFYAFSFVKRVFT